MGPVDKTGNCHSSLGRRALFSSRGLPADGYDGDEGIQSGSIINNWEVPEFHCLKNPAAHLQLSRPYTGIRWLERSHLSTVSFQRLSRKLLIREKHDVLHTLIRFWRMLKSVVLVDPHSFFFDQL